MIVVKVELWPFGNEEYMKEIAYAEIVNDGTGTKTKGNYKVRLFKRNSRTSVWKTWYMKGWRREALPVFNLVACAIVGALGPESVKKWTFKGVSK